MTTSAFSKTPTEGNTFVNGRRIEDCTCLRGNDLVKMGRILLKFNV